LKACAKAVLVLVVSERAVFWVKHLVFEKVLLTKKTPEKGEMRVTSPLVPGSNPSCPPLPMEKWWNST